MSVYAPKNEVVKSGKPFQHRDGTWYLPLQNGWRKLRRFGDTLVDKQGIVHGTFKPAL